ncbi:MAG TPA: VanZ family protein [Pirellulales bacterium]|jgi:VanZ family protein
MDNRPDFLVRMGVGLPCTSVDVEQAYLEKVKLAHPDRGGTQQDFLDLQTAYQRAKEFAKFQDSRRHWLGDAIERYALQQELVAELGRRGGSVQVRQLDWLAGEIGEDFAQVLEVIDGISLVGPACDDRAIEELTVHQDVLGQMHSLDLSGSNVTDAGARRLTAFPYLRRVNLTDTHVGNATLKECAKLAKLEWLGVGGTHVTRFGRFWLRVARPDLQIGRTRANVTRGFRSHVPLLTLACILYVAAMATATHVPLDGVRLPEWRLVPVDKAFHFTAYAGLSFLLSTLAAAIWTGSASKRWGHLLRYFAVLPVVALYGVIDELTQPAVGRTADSLDWLADMCGAASGLVLFLVMRFVLKRQAERRWAHLATQRLVPRN